MEDHYKTLGLKRGASSKEISAAYRSQALIHHPDKKRHNTSTSTSTSNETDHTEHFHKIKTAYQALQDPKIRAELDLQLLGQEERIKRDEQMSVQRKKLRDDLLHREQAISSRPISPPQNKKRPAYNNLSNTDSCLILKCQRSSLTSSSAFLDMIKASLGPEIILQIFQSPDVSNQVVAEFKNPQEAYQALSKLPNDLIVKADWFNGYPPNNLTISFSSKTTQKISTEKKDNQQSAQYSKELETLVLEKLLQKKKLKQQQQQQQQQQEEYKGKEEKKDSV